MWQLQAAYSWRFCGGRLPDECGSWKLNLLYFFFGGRLPGENVTAASCLFLTVLRWQAPRWVWQLKTKPSLPFFCGGRLPGENVTAASWIFLTFLRWQAPRWKCDTCKLHLLWFFAVAGSQMSASVESWTFLTFFFAVADSQVKMCIFAVAGPQMSAAVESWTFFFSRRQVVTFASGSWYEVVVWGRPLRSNVVRIELFLLPKQVPVAAAAIMSNLICSCCFWQAELAMRDEFNVGLRCLNVQDTTKGFGSFWQQNGGHGSPKHLRSV